FFDFVNKKYLFKTLYEYLLLNQLKNSKIKTQGGNSMTGERIKKLRKEKGLTQEQLGNLLGVKKSAIAKYENNRVYNLKKDTIQKLSEIFEVPATYFLGKIGRASCRERD